MDEWLDQAKIECEKKNISFCRAVEYVLDGFKKSGLSPDQAVISLQKMGVNTMNNFAIIQGRQ